MAERNAGTSTSGSMQLLYIVIADKESIVTHTNFERTPGCKYSVFEGLMVVQCSTVVQLVQLVLSLIELGVSPLAPAAWLCGPAGELAKLYDIQPNPCPAASVDRIGILCRAYSVCTQVYNEIINNKYQVRSVRLRKHSKCYDVQVRFDQPLPLPRLLNTIIGGLEEAHHIMLLSPRILPPLKWELASKTWVHRCLQSRAQSPYKSSRTK